MITSFSSSKRDPELQSCKFLSISLLQASQFNVLSFNRGSPIDMASSHDPEKGPISQSPAQSPTQPASYGIDDISPAASTHLDDNYELYKHAKDIEADPAELKRVLRKIDFRIIPILFVTYMLQYLDKNSINFSSVYGLQKGTHLEGQDYSWLGT
jgi:hypothetical protein